MHAPNQLFFILPVMLANLPVEIEADPRTGVELAHLDAVFANCTINVKGISGEHLRFTAPFQTSTTGAFITYIRVDNLKLREQATGGGVNSPYVNFEMVTTKNHGLWFQFNIYGRTPFGTSEVPLTGSCKKS